MALSEANASNGSSIAIVGYANATDSNYGLSRVELLDGGEPVELAGSAQGQATATGNLTHGVPLAGAAFGQGGVSASLAVPGGSYLYGGDGGNGAGILNPSPDEEFDWVESASTMLEEEPRVIETSFGDGYAQRSPDGLNSNPQMWELRFSDVELEKADAIIGFWRARLGVTPFRWVPLWHTVSRRFVCKRWTRTHPNEWGQCDISARFEQVFEP